ncbi:MAG: alpha/beta hydrolase [Actinomycetota bacterium]|nr:alpha/beta hydrolase [Actinomycetota bacterium]
MTAGSNARRTLAIGLALALGAIAPACGSVGEDEPTAAQTDESAPSTTTTSITVRPSTSTTAAPATTTDTAPATTTTAAAPRAFEPTLSWSPCGDARCGTITVPEDHDDPGGATTELAIAMAPARAQRIGVLFVAPGGPGGSGVDLALARGGLPASIAARFDIVGIDQRGVGASGTLACAGALEAFWPLDPSPDDAAELADLRAGAAAFSSTCAASEGDRLARYGTDTLVADIEMVRRALGAPQLTLHGMSYGSYTVQRYAEAHPDRVRAAVIEGVVDPGDDLTGFLATQAAAIEQALEQILVGAGAADTYTTVAARLEQSPIDGAGPAELARAAALATYGPSDAEAFVAALRRAAAGDGSGIVALDGTYHGLVDFALYTAALCRDWEAPRDPAAWSTAVAAAEASAPMTAAPTINELLPCATWSAEAAYEPGPIDVGADAPPFLVVGNTLDPITPYDDAAGVAAAIGGSRLVTIAIPGHRRFNTNACAATIVEGFAVDLRLPGAATTC